MLLSEVLNKPYKFKVTKDNPIWFQAYFHTDEGTKVSFGAVSYSDDTHWAISFHSQQPHETKGSFDTTGGGDQFRIFATVLAITAKFIKERNPDSIHFSAKEGNRQNLYKKLIGKYAKKLGYDTKGRAGDQFVLKKI